MEFYDEKIKALAIEIYELDAEVYKKLGSSLGRVFGGEKDICIRNIMEDLHSRQNSSRIRSELALISNMARTIPDHDTRHDIMVRYNNIVEEIAELPTGFADGDILDPKIADLNTVNLKDRFKTGDHLIICIGRSCGCGGNEIGFALADKLRMNFYDVSVMNEVFRQKDGEEAAQVHMNCSYIGRELYIEISDSGVGIQDVAKAMEPLYTSKPQLDRSGMGFSFMEAFMDALTVTSEPGHGTTVKMKKVL